VRTRTIAAALLLLCLALSAAFAEESWLNRPESKVRFAFSAELGFLSVLSHSIQFGKGGTEFDYVADGGQDVYFPFQRISADISFGQRHKLVLLYQPIDIRTEVRFFENVKVYDVDFDGATPLDGLPMELRYGFDYYRVSYLYDFWKDPRNELAAGLSLQVRDAVIVFAAKDGSGTVANEDVGPVPILKLRWKSYLGPTWWLGSEIDGFYASGRYITGTSNDFVGAILDASLRGGFTPRDGLDVFLNVRYLGGGAVGTDEEEAVSAERDGYARNWLHTLSVSLGVTVR
jgi:hypothetical protein